MCWQCPSNWYKAASTCKQCPARYFSLPLFLLFIIITGFLVFSYYRLNEEWSANASAAVRITISFSLLALFFQQIALLSNLQFDSAGAVKDLLSVFDVMLLNFGAMQGECMFGGKTGLDQYAFIVALPGMLLVLMASLYGASCVNTVLFIYMTIYVLVCTQILAPYQCMTHPAGPSTLEEYPLVECGSGEHNSMVILGYAVRYKFLISRFHPKSWWWGVVHLFKNLLISLVPIMEPNDGRIQVAALSLVFLAFTIGVVRVWPWIDDWNNYLDLALNVSFLYILTAVMAWTEKTDKGQTTLAASVIVVFTAFLVVCLGVMLLGVANCFPAMKRREMARRSGLIARLLRSFQMLTKEVQKAEAGEKGASDWRISVLEIAQHDVISLERFLEVCDTELLHTSGFDFAHVAKQQKRGSMFSSSGGAPRSRRLLISKRHLKALQDDDPIRDAEAGVRSDREMLPDRAQDYEQEEEEQEGDDRDEDGEEEEDDPFDDEIPEEEESPTHAHARGNHEGRGDHNHEIHEGASVEDEGGEQERGDEFDGSIPEEQEDDGAVNRSMHFPESPQNRGAQRQMGAQDMGGS
eukprot:Cvel_3036.t2-p1 / transcript=Cvel_3036.t2 / gene=Cvel_3036 / organism=Chromera_velia_CCMP2878 / gene_product=Signal peptide, CUB and EGF-like domain-containing, putative / transcript_product=Signal peptide, CUB and EGF-like domain-containing, putative / location=Cvel_scaffold121:59947-63979(-) / protein_length=578 / sequence_SO=supercontig / SO=protein_coding / is_pseudo=false